MMCEEEVLLLLFLFQMIYAATCCFLTYSYHRRGDSGTGNRRHQIKLSWIVTSAHIVQVLLIRRMSEPTFLASAWCRGIHCRRLHPWLSHRFSFVKNTDSVLTIANQARRSHGLHSSRSTTTISASSKKPFLMAAAAAGSPFFSSSSVSTSSAPELHHLDEQSVAKTNDENATIYPISRSTPPWNHPRLFEKGEGSTSDTTTTTSRRNKSRFRQHVNPLAAPYQLPTILSDDWPKDVYQDCSKPLHIDIGCGKGGFLMDLVTYRYNKTIRSHQQQGEQHPIGGSDETDKEWNYLGLEIRPLVAQYAKDRMHAKPQLTGVLDILGCNANVDLDRLLKRYCSVKGGQVQLVTIQFPDPQFKSYHNKRKVVTPLLVQTLSQYLPTNAHVFVQSDIQNVTDDMIQQFLLADDYYKVDTRYHCFDTPVSNNTYLNVNPFPIPTEREASVLKQNLPVYRTMLIRSDKSYLPSP